MADKFSQNLYLFLKDKHIKTTSCMCHVCKIRADTSPSYFTDSIGKAVLALSYTYRKEFRRNFEKAYLPLEERSGDKFHSLALIFAVIVSQKYTPFKFLMVCSLISELYMYRYFFMEDIYGDDLCEQCVHCPQTCFMFIYQQVLAKHVSSIPEWRAVDIVSQRFAKAYELLEPLICREFVFSDTTCLLRSAKETGLVNQIGEVKYPREQTSSAAAVPEDDKKSILELDLYLSDSNSDGTEQIAPENSPV